MNDDMQFEKCPECGRKYEDYHGDEDEEMSEQEF